jgi:hypothetical protein
VSEETAHRIAELLADGVLRRDEQGGLRTTRRWQAAMARAALDLLECGADANDGNDLRVPIAVALIDIYGADTSDDRIAELVAVMLPIEMRELDPRLPIDSSP